MKKKVFIADYMFNVAPKVPRQRWRELERRYQLVTHNFKRPLTIEDAFSLSRGCAGIAAGVEKVYDRNFFDRFPEVKCIVRTGSGMDNIDLKCARKKGVVVRNCPEAVTEAAAELSIAVVLSLLRKIPQADREVRQGKWNQSHGRLLANKTVGIVGVGRVGKRVAALLKPFGCQVLGNDLDPQLTWFKKHGVRHSSKSYLYKASDIICFHPSMLPQNWHMIDNKTFREMKNGVVIVNLSRGPIINEQALVKNLQSGKVAAAGLDVFENEPYHGPLAAMENVILTPHIGGSTEESRYLMQMQALDYLDEELLKIP